jgi:transcription antitermination factor NusG
MGSVLSTATNDSVITVPEFPSDNGPQWFAAHVRSRHEKKVAMQLEKSDLECFLPLYEARHRWQDRNAKVSLPLFPGYVFTRIQAQERMRVLTISGVVSLVGVHGRPSPIAKQEIESLRLCLSRDGSLQPHPYLSSGRRVRITSGPFADAEGILARRKGRCRLVVSIHLLERSVAVEVDAGDVRPI